MKGDSLPRLLAPAIPRYGEDLVGAIEWAMQVDDKKRPRSVGEWRGRLFGRQAPPAATMLVTGPPRVTAPPDSPEAAVEALARAITTASPDTSDIRGLLEKREQLDRAMKEKFQRVLTVMFTDLKGSTAIAEATGDFEVRAMLKIYHDLCTEAVRSNGGTLVKTIGDGSLSHFTDALAACRAAATIQRGMEELNLSRRFPSLLLVRIGLHTGECILEKNDIFGDVVNTASRFESSAKPGEILISEETYNALSSKTEFYARFDREVTLKGKALPYKAYIVFWDPKEIEVDRARPAQAARASTPAWKIGVSILIPLVVIGAAAYYFTAAGRIGSESTRSINYSVPK
jgi:class 3 adenylate cyclase